MTAGSITPNLFDRLALAFGRATKAAVQPGKLYPPPGPASGYPISWEGWPDLGGTGRGLSGGQSAQGAVDERNARRAVQSAWVYSCCAAIAQEMSSATLIVKRRAGDAGDEDIENHPFERVWEAPNPLMGRSFMMQFWTWQLLLSGEAYLYLIPGADGIAEIWPIPSWYMEPIPDVKAFIRGYVFRARGATEGIPLDPRLVCYSRLPNPFDPRRGLSPLVSIMDAVDSDLAMRAWNKNFFSKENAAPTGIIAVPRDTLDLDMARIRQEIADFFGGGQRRVGVARAGDLAWTPFDRSQKDMEFLSGREFARGEIERAFGIPEGYFAKDATRANAEGAKATMIEMAVWPKLTLLAEDLNAQIVPVHYSEDERATFDDIRPRNRALELQELTSYAQFSTIDELRQQVNLAPIGDYRGLLLLEELKKAMPLPGTPASEEAEAAVAAMEAAAEPVVEEVTPADTDAGLPPAEESPLDAETPPMEEGGTIPEEVKRADLARWERKALKALRTRGRAGVGFESDAIGAEEAERISEALRGAQTAEEVRAAFKAAGDEPDIDGVWDEAMKWARLAMGGE